MRRIGSRVILVSAQAGLTCLEIDKLQGRALERRPQMNRAGFATVSEEPRHRRQRYVPLKLDLAWEDSMGA